MLTSHIKISYYPFINLQKSIGLHCADLTMILKKMIFLTQSNYLI